MCQAFARDCAILSVLVIAGTAFGGDGGAPPGLDRRLPWDDSRVVGSPDPPPPYRTAPAFPDLELTQPLTLDAEPGRDAYLVIQHLGSWAPPGKILRLADDPAAESCQIVLELEGIAYELAFHPDYEQNGLRLRRPEYAGRRRALHAGLAVHGRPRAAARDRPGHGGRHHRVALERPQRRRRRLRRRRHALRHLRRRHERLRRQPPRPGPLGAHEQGPADRRRPPRPRAELRRPARQPLRRRRRRPARDLGLRAPQPLADDLRPGPRSALGRQQRPGPLGVGVPDRAGRQLRLERLRGQPPLLPRTGPSAPTR